MATHDRSLHARALCLKAPHQLRVKYAAHIQRTLHTIHFLMRLVDDPMVDVAKRLDKSKRRLVRRKVRAQVVRRQFLDQRHFELGLSALTRGPAATPLYRTVAYAFLPHCRRGRQWGRRGWCQRGLALGGRGLMLGARVRSMHSQTRLALTTFVVVIVLLHVNH
jgi:hypothetical protein